MFPPVIIDISNTIKDFTLSEEEVKSFSRYILASISREYMLQWEKLVDNNLKKTRSSYKAGMSYEIVDDFNAIFTMEGKGESVLGLMIEKGVSPFDIKEGFEKSSKKHIKKDGGWYLTVPFRLATSEALAESQAFSGRLPKPIEDIAKKQEHGIKVSELPNEFKMKDLRPEIQLKGGGVIPEYKHKSPKFAGVIHGKKEKHGQYFKFRRASDNNDNKFSWIHKGFTARNFMEKAFENMQIDKTFEVARDEFLSKR
jgi:hypothetical protein